MNRAERRAVLHYRLRGYRILGTNVWAGGNEIDVVARRGDTLVFVEVKTRRSDQWGLPAEAVGAAKQAQLKRLAAAWLGEHKPGYVEVRFDIVSVIVREPEEVLDVTHIPDAF